MRRLVFWLVVVSVIGAVLYWLVGMSVKEIIVCVLAMFAAYGAGVGIGIDEGDERVRAVIAEYERQKERIT